MPRILIAGLGNITREGALDTARMLADYGVHWFEEAHDPDAVKRYTGGVNLLDR